MGAEISKEDRLDGELFRRGPVVISDGKKEAIHRGINGEDEIKARLQMALDIQQDGKPHALIGLFVGHFMLEHTHPFYDGNGRFGRFLLALRLRATLSAPTAISLSAEVLRQKPKYYKAFTTLGDPMTKGEATFFVSDMMEILRDAQRELIDSLHDKLHRLQQVTARVDEIESGGGGLGHKHAQALHILGLDLLFGLGAGVSLEDCIHFIGRSRGTVRPVMAELVERGLVTELSRKPLVFALTDAGQEFIGLD